MSFDVDRCEAETVHVPFAGEPRFFSAYEITYNNDEDLEIALYPLKEDGETEQTIVARFYNYRYISIIDERIFGLYYDLSVPKIEYGKNKGYSFPFMEIRESKRMSSVVEVYKRDFGMDGMVIRQFMVMTLDYIIEILCEDLGIFRK